MCVCKMCAKAAALHYRMCAIYRVVLRRFVYIHIVAYHHTQTTDTECCLPMCFANSFVNENRPLFYFPLIESNAIELDLAKGCLCVCVF